jgi:hypothetical protein
VLDQDLPHLSASWTKIEANDKTFSFQREVDMSTTFSISGYISKSSWATTRAEAEGLNNSLIATPSGIFTDGYGTQYAVLVEDWLIKPVPAANKYTFSMSFRKLA